MVLPELRPRQFYHAGLRMTVLDPCFKACDDLAMLIGRSWRAYTLPLASSGYEALARKFWPGWG